LSLSAGAWLCLALAGGVAMADGGAVQWRERAGPYTVTVFTAPVPARAGPVDFSVLVQRAADNEVVLDAVVALRLTMAGEVDVRGEATHDQATDKLLYSANLNPRKPGVWQLEVQVRGADGNGSTTGPIRLLEAESGAWNYWPYFAVVPVFVCLFIVNRYLKRRVRR
jgi:hypothetical protein